MRDAQDELPKDNAVWDAFDNRGDQFSARMTGRDIDIVRYYFCFFYNVISIHLCALHNSINGSKRNRVGHKEREREKEKKMDHSETNVSPSWPNAIGEKRPRPRPRPE